MRRLCNREGFIKPLLTIVILAAAFYAGFQFAVPYYHYESFKSDVKELALIGLGDINKVKANVLQAAEENRIPIEEGDIIVTKKLNTVRVQTSWSETVDILGLYQKTLDFRIDVEG